MDEVRMRDIVSIVNAHHNSKLKTKINYLCVVDLKMCG